MLLRELPDGSVVVAFAEDDLRRPVDVHAAFEDLIFERGVRRITADLSEVRALTSLMIGTLVSLHLLAYENVVILSFTGMHEKLVALFRLIGIDKLMEAHYAPPAEGANA